VTFLSLYLEREGINIVYIVWGKNAEPNYLPSLLPLMGLLFHNFGDDKALH
jgi:hypothetical protein